MNETSTNCSGLLTASGRSTLLGYSGTTTLGNTGVSSGNWLNTNLPNTIITSTQGNGITLQGNSTINFAPTQIRDMTPKQVNVAVFTITRDVDTNEINSTKFVKELWVEQKNGTSIDLIVAKQLDKDFDPEFTIIKVLATVSF